MRIEELRPDLYLLPDNDAFKLFCTYYDQRSADLDAVVVMLSKPRKRKAGKKRKKKDEVTVSSSDLEMLKKLGLV